MKALCGLQAERAARYAADARFSGVRRLGTIVALDLKIPQSGYLATISLDLMRFFNARGLLLPPYDHEAVYLPVRGGVCSGWE